MVKNLIPKPADGKVRALFADKAGSSMHRRGVNSLMTGSRRNNAIDASKYYSMQSGGTNLEPSNAYNTTVDPSVT